MIEKLFERGLAAVGLIVVAVGGVALMLRPVSVVHPRADLDTRVVVIPPEVLTLDGLGEITVTAPSTFDVRTARPSDAYAWAMGVEVGVVRGLETWEDLEVDRAGTVSGEVPDFSGDLWRGWVFAYEDAAIDPVDLESGLAVVIVSGSGSPLTSLTFEMIRDRGNGWAWPTLAAGLGALTAGLALDAIRLIRARLRTSGKDAS